MLTDQPRPYKIDLVISKRRKQTMAASVNHGEAEGQTENMFKKGNCQKMVYLTVQSRVLDNNRKLSTNPQTAHHSGQHILVSEFSADVFRGNQSKNKQNEMPNGQNSSMLSSVRQIKQAEQKNKWWQYLKYPEENPKQDYINEILKKEKKILYFKNLLVANQNQFNSEKQEKVNKYEYYLAKLKESYALQMQETKKMVKMLRDIQQQKKEDVYRQLRLKINQDGKRGLNYSPKRMSVFSGMTGTILLSKDSSNSASRRQENFSFGSIAPDRRVVSADKSNQCTTFMSPGRARISKRKIAFNQS